ncbi:MAG: ABC transporter substrate-binding protein [Acetobacteraceae bacterium]
MSEHANETALPRFRLALLAIAAVLIGAMAGWSISPLFAAGAASGARVIRFGADFTEPPGQVIIDGKMSGSDYELCNALAKRMDATAHWTNIDFGTLIAAIGADRIDAACSSVDITPARQAVVNFVPYRIDSEGAAVQRGNPKHVESPADMCGLNAAELLGSVYQTVVEEQSKACVKAGKKPIDLRTFNTTADAFAQLLNGRADIVVGDAPIMAYYVKKEPTKTAMAFQGVKPKGVGIALSKKNGVLEEELKAALKELRTDGTYAKILAKWNLQSEALKP